ncbi:MAG: hypothetical protein A2Z03_10660 [Chloroflexi bacterium RBG_16_56_8]|nr:MAG: hypothetical protein A2Z03_10660 [Chloroflexi bacterium RBG_16_56_8]
MTSHKGNFPQASRPYMPDYGVQNAQSGKGLLAWNWAVEQLSNARNYWIATTRPDGQPNMTPVWGVWLDEAFYFSSGARSRKARNLAVNPKCVISTDQANVPVILEGRARRVSNHALLRHVAEAYSKKYQWQLEPTAEGVRDSHGNGGPVFAVHPHVVFAFNEDLAGSATRWVFEDD